MNQVIEPSHSTDLWWIIPGVLAGMSRPFIHADRPETPNAPLHAFPDELPRLWKAGIRGVVCMLNMPSAAATYQSAGFAFHLMPVPDGDAPSMEQFVKFVGFVTRQRALGHPVAVHCEAGIGRTGTALAGYLVAAHGMSPEEAILQVRAQRTGAVETGRQVQFLWALRGISG
jgi:polymorphic toxin system DSP-PTPase phosphatase-like protein